MNKPRAVSRAELVHQQSHPPATSPTKRPAKRNPNIDITKTKAYKTASRRWVSTIVALPILIYTSWELYERTYGTKVQKRLVEPGKEE